MIVIDNKLISDEVVEEQFVCDLEKCKGGCCEDGDAGAPLEDWEMKEVDKFYTTILPYMTQEGIQAVQEQGKYLYHQEFGNVTPTVNNGICAYGYKNKQGTIICAFEEAYNKGEITWKKPLSCHLFPIKISQSKEDPDLEYINYEPRQDLCQAACKLGKKLKVPAYQFLKESLIRKYGQEFYDVLDAAAAQLKG